MQSLSKSDEQRLLDGVKTAVDLVDNQSFSPNDAIQKVAEQLHYSPGFLKSACNAFNTGRQLAQWNSNESVLDKLASFPLADYDLIHDAMWGKTQEKVASASLLPPTLPTYDAVRQELLAYDLGSFVKAGSAEIEPHIVDEKNGIRVKRAFDAFDYQRKLTDEARRQKQAADDRLNLRLHLLESYFQKFSYDRLPLAQVEHAAAVHFGEPGKQLMVYVAERFPSEKRASDHRVTWDGFKAVANYKSEPYTLIESVIKQAHELNHAQADLKQSQVKLAEVKDFYESFIQASRGVSESHRELTPSLIPYSIEKVSADPTMGMGLNAAKQIADYASKDRDSKIESQINELDSPDHTNELRKIQAQTVLTQLMSDPDNPISGYDPEKVLNAYNEMVQLAPRLADQPAAIGPLLAKRMVGHTEPFEVGEMLKLDKSLKDTQAPPNPTNMMKNEASILS